MRAEPWIAELRERSGEIEAARRVPEDLSRRLAVEGFYRMLVPAALGGGEVHPAVFARTLETLARGDAATAWVVMTGSTTGVLMAWLDPEAAATILGESQESALAGVFAPMARATAEPGGFRLSGRWPYASGCENAAWRMGGAVVRTAAGPVVRSMFFRASDSVVHDTWNVSGLRGTGSHDVQVDDLVVPGAFTTSVFTDRPHHPGPLYRFPVFGLLAVGISAVGLGIARAALDDATALIRTKPTRGGAKTMAESELVQVRLATAEGELLAARSGVMGVLDALWGGEIDDADKARLRLSATHAARASVRVVHAVCDLVGGAAIRTEDRFQRYRRDVDVLASHIMVGEQTYKPIGRILLGLPTDTAGL